MNWKLSESENYSDVMATHQINSLLAKYLDAKQIDFSLYSMKDSLLHDYYLLNDSKKIIDRIETAILNQEKIVVYGDYDCDGIMATSILVAAFERRGIQVGYHIPNRFIDGYGLNEERVKQMHEKGYTLIITVDNGIKAFDAIDCANELGIDVIITDHHDVGDKQPNSYATLHTMLSPNYPFKEISGGFLAYKLATKIIGNNDLYLFCLAGLSTVSDMMPLWNENRTLVKQMIKILKKYKFESFELLLNENQEYTVQNLAFQMVPKINSIGRIAEDLNPNQCVIYFKSPFAKSDKEREFKMKFSTLAYQINDTRKQLTNEQYNQAIKLKESKRNTIFVYDTSFHEGLIGLIAGKLTNKYNKPSFVLSYDEGRQEYKGSARSIEGFALNAVFDELKDMMLVYGGHELAGGFSLSRNKIEEFSNAIENRYNDMMNTIIMGGSKEAVLISVDDISIQNVKQLQYLEPFGTKNEEPIFCLQNIKPIKVETLSQGEHLKLHFEFKNLKLQALFFNHGDKVDEIKKKETLTMIGTISINKFRNFESVQFMLLDII